MIAAVPTPTSFLVAHSRRDCCWMGGRGWIIFLDTNWLEVRFQKSEKDKKDFDGINRITTGFFRDR